MGLLDIEENINIDIDLINHIFEKWVKAHTYGCKACGLVLWNGDHWKHLKSVPQDYLNWVCYKCIRINNSGYYSCIISDPDLDLDIYEPIYNFSNFNFKQAFHTPELTVNDLLKWYNNIN